MPYIKQDRRKQIDSIVEAMHKESICANGDLNYILFSYFKKYIDKNYNSIKNYCGELTECTEEIRRRILSEYEDQKVLENGDI